jgi:LmbE family N-acetylglucosaminyl deacetylase
VTHAVLAVFAHPDDEFSIAPLAARCAAEGHRVRLVSITSGQRGARPGVSIPKGDELGAVREEELRCAAAALGVPEPVLLGFEDQGISGLEAATAIAGRLRELIAELRPDVMITFGPDGITGHPDHRAAGNIATEVFQEGRKLAYRPRKLYYVVIPETARAAIPPEIDGRLRATSDDLVTTVVDCRPWLDRAARAVRCHATQWTPERMEQFDKLNREVFGGRVYLRLALSLVPPPAVREAHIFERL